MIAIALACTPSLLIADEPTTALDVTIQGQVLDLLRTLREESGMGLLFITHDLGVVAEIADQVAVMYAGRIVEEGDVRGVFEQPRHPYTRALLQSLPRLDRTGTAEKRALAPIPGQVPSPLLLPQGCAFAPRCALRPTRLHRGRATARTDRRRPRRPLPPLARDHPMIEVQDLEVTYGRTRIVHGVSFTLAPGEVLGLVGESGSGKTTIGRAILRLLTPSAGHIRIDGRDVTTLSRRAMRPLRRHVQMIFQDPYSSLDPRLTVQALITEALAIHRIGRRAGWPDRVAELLGQVGLPADAMRRYPHEFSGGQRQRIGIARALAVEPRTIIADEPVSALDVSVQAQVINLLEDLRQRLALGILFIAHDLAVVQHVSDRVAVLYMGRIMELAPSPALYARPRHPYTLALLDAAPTPDPHYRPQRRPLQGEIPRPDAPTQRLRLPHPLPPRPPRLRQRCARAQAGRTGPLEGLHP